MASIFLKSLYRFVNCFGCLEGVIFVQCYCYYLASKFIRLSKFYTRFYNILSSSRPSEEAGKTNNNNNSTFSSKTRFYWQGIFLTSKITLALNFFNVPMKIDKVKREAKIFRKKLTFHSLALCSMETEFAGFQR